MKTSFLIGVLAVVATLTALTNVTSHETHGLLPDVADDALQPKTSPQFTKSVTLEQCMVSVIDDIELPAHEAGVLRELRVREGAAVKASELVAQVDDQRAELQERVATNQHNQALAQAKNDVEVRYSKAAAAVSHAEHAEAVAANGISSGAVAPTEVRRLELTSRRSDLAIEQAALEHEVAGLAERVRAAELRLASHDRERRRITSPINGVVVEVHKQPGEWLQAGESLLRIVRMDLLRVEGFVDAAQLGDEEVVDCAVEISVPRQRGLKKTFKGKIVFVNPVIEASGNYRVFAEVQNREENGRWLLRPGMEAEMTIGLKVPIQLTGQPQRAAKRR